MGVPAVESGLPANPDLGLTPAKASAPANYVRGFDGIRAIAVGMVLVSHAGYGELIPGGFGVTVFFAISGYLITTILLRELASTQSIDLKSFYLRRILRLYPELLALIALCGLLSSYMGVHGTIWEWLAPPLYFMNYYYVYGAHYNLSETIPWRNLWSLPVEEHFYMVFPVLMLCMARKRAAQLNLVYALILLPFLWRFITYFVLGLPWQHNYVATDTRIESIAWGCLLAILLRNEDARQRSIETLWFIRRWMPAVALALILASLIYRDEGFRWTWRFTVQGIGITLLLANILFDPRWKPVVNFLELPPLRYLGRISYGLYLYHMLVDRLLSNAYPTMPVPYFLVASTAATIALASVSYLVLETPLKGLRRRLGSYVR